MGAKLYGGKKLKKILKNIKSTRNVRLLVGYFPESRYDNGMPVAQVGFWNEFGTVKIPERPFMRHANVIATKKLTYMLKNQNYFSSTNKFNLQGINKVGQMWVNSIQLSIEGYGITYVPNAPSTIKQKGHDKPLIDSELMLNSPEYKVMPL